MFHERQAAPHPIRTLFVRDFTDTHTGTYGARSRWTSLLRGYRDWILFPFIWPFTLHAKLQRLGPFIRQYPYPSCYAVKSDRIVKRIIRYKDFISRKNPVKPDGGQNGEAYYQSYQKAIPRIHVPSSMRSFIVYSCTWLCSKLLSTKKAECVIGRNPSCTGRTRQRGWCLRHLGTCSGGAGACTTCSGGAGACAICPQSAWSSIHLRKKQTEMNAP